MELHSAWDQAPSTEPPDPGAEPSGPGADLDVAHAVRPHEITSLCHRPMAYWPGSRWPPPTPQRFCAACWHISQAGESSTVPGSAPADAASGRRSWRRRPKSSGRW